MLVHRRQLLDQWVARLGTFLDLPPEAIGQIGGGKRKPTGIVDVAVIQSLLRKGEADDLPGDYGHLVVDECHHLSAVGFEAVVPRCKARYVLGLSATVTRKDGHHPIVFMQCCPVRFRVDARKQASLRPFRHRVAVRRTGFRPSPAMAEGRPAIQDLYAALAADEGRLDTLFLTLPISWRGTLAQYAGRLHLLHPDRREVVVYDYVDEAVPVLARMAAKRMKGYAYLGYDIQPTAELE
ncbi:MAG: DEAD/DEAH box helicase family protein [Magnetospirillum sp. WYHS-4]